MTRAKRVVLLAGVVLLVIWVLTHQSRLTADPEGVIRLVLGLFFFLWIMLRAKSPLDEGSVLLRWDPPAQLVGGAGALMALGGLIFDVHQVEWLGIMLLLYACFRWSLPQRWRHDMMWALFILYWIHPLPTQIFGGFELHLQKASIKGSEWLLHVFNVPVWADGFILHSGYLAFGVPESCSGAMTAVAVLMCILGLTIVLEFRWYEGVIFALIGLVQVLALNIIRIAGMVFWGRNMEQAWANNVLHDTLGIFLLVAIALIHFEAFAWTRRAEKEEKPYGFLPKTWKQLTDWTPRILMLLLLLGLIAYGAARRRPYRHARMLLQVVKSLQDTNLEQAERAIREAEQLDPANRDILDERLNVMIKREKYEQVLEEINAMEAPTTLELVMKAQVLTGLEQIAEAYAILKALPREADAWPGVAIIRAEYAAVRDDPAEVRRRMPVAAQDSANLNRVRALFPFLAKYEQWKTIADVESTAPHQVLDQALIGIRALLITGWLDEAAPALRRALNRWPDEPRLFNLAHDIALKRPQSGLGDLFASRVLASVEALDVDFLSLYIDYGFDVGRPDVAWVAYQHLERLDASDPALFLGVARNAHRWFVFGNVVPDGGEAGDDAAAIVREQQQLAAYMERWGQIPLESVLRDCDADAVRKTYVAQALTELERRERSGDMTERMYLIYPKALILAERFDEAQQRLAAIAESHPHLRRSVWLQSAKLYAVQKQWQELYEQSRRLFEGKDRPDLEVSLLLLNACAELRMGLSAMDIAVLTRRRFPDAPQSRIGLAAAWLAVGAPEDALFVLEEDEGWLPFPGLPQTLYNTGRIKEARKLGRLMNITLQDPPGGVRQPLDLAAAEAVIYGQLPEVPPEASWPELAARKRRAADQSFSPFVQGLLRLEARWYSGARTADPIVWEGVGRDVREKATALHRLAIFSASHGDKAAAQVALRRGLTFLPRAPGLWRLLSALEGTDAVARKAIAHCPTDPVLWLGALVTRVRATEEGETDEANAWALNYVANAIRGRRFSVETLVRGGSFLVRYGLTEAASLAARDSVKRSRALLAAHALETRCAIVTEDARWALGASHRAIEVALDPEPFYRTIAYIKLDFGIADADAMRAFQYLAQNTKPSAIWEEKLGVAYYKQGQFRRSAEILRKVAADPEFIRHIELALLTAESERLLGETAMNLRTLRAAYAREPDRLDTVNNLAYALAQDKQTVPQAVALLPKLISLAEDNYLAWDTIAIIYLRSGNIEEAKRWTEKALANAPEEGYLAAEAYMNAAEIYYEAGDRKAALNLIETARKRAKLPPDLDRRALELLWKIQRGPDESLNR